MSAIKSLAGLPQLKRSSDRCRVFRKSSSPTPDDDIANVPAVFRDVYIDHTPSERELKMMSIAWRCVVPINMRGYIDPISQFDGKVADASEIVHVDRLGNTFDFNDRVLSSLFTTYSSPRDARPMFFLDCSNHLVKQVLTLKRNPWGNPYLEILKKMPVLFNPETMSSRWAVIHHVPEEMKHWFSKDDAGYYSYVRCPFLDGVYREEKAAFKGIKSSSASPKRRGKK